MKKFVLAYNPVSGNATFKKRLDEIIEVFQRRKILLIPYRTRAAENSDFAECVKESGAEGSLSAGGDGTLHLVVNLMMKNKIDLPVGIIGSGTSNDFATYLKIDGGEDYFDVIAEGITRPADLGLANDKEYFINVACAGAFTAVAHEANTKLKNIFGKRAYYFRGISELPKFKSVRLEIIADGQSFGEDAFLFLVLNGSAVAGFKKILESAEIDDGKLDFVAVKKSGPGLLVPLMKNIFSGKAVDENPGILHIRARNFEIKSSENLVGDLDGESGDPLPLKIETIPQALRFFAR